MKPLKELGYVSVGMTITDINGLHSTITEIIIPSIKQNVSTAKLPIGNDLILRFEDGQYLYTDIGWENLDNRILVVSQKPNFLA